MNILIRIPISRNCGSAFTDRSNLIVLNSVKLNTRNVIANRHLAVAVSQFLGDEKELIASGDDDLRPYEPTFACTKCHRIRYWSSLHHNAWNQLVAYMSGGLLYGTEVEKPEWFTPRRRRTYARHKSDMKQGKRVERLLNDGLSYLEIAEQMGLTLSGVQGHVKRLYKRRGVRSRKALKALARQ